MIPAFPKPSQIRTVKPAVKVFRDGREVCDQLTKAGRDEYERRKRLMWERQKKVCTLCNQKLAWAETTFDHSDGRGMGAGHRDDRIEKDGKPYNAAVHWLCNSLKGSRRITSLVGEVVP